MAQETDAINDQIFVDKINIFCSWNTYRIDAIEGTLL